MLDDCGTAGLRLTASKEHAQLAAAQGRSQSSFQEQEQLVPVDKIQLDSILKALTRLELKINVNTNTKELESKFNVNTEELKRES